MTAKPAQGPLTGLRVLEFEGVGPIQLAGMMLSDMGADVIRIDRPDAEPLLRLDYNILDRGRRSITLDLKSADGLDVAVKLAERADILIEGYRPGVMERLGLSPEELCATNSRLIYGRVTGWGQTGPLANAAGHDINYIAITGALHAIGLPDSGPVVPLNLIGDFGGGSMLLLVGVLSALHERERTGKGQVIDAAITDGTALLMGMTQALHAAGRWSMSRGSNLLDGGTPFYGTYVCADGKWISVGPLERKFFVTLLEALGIDPARFPNPADPSCWNHLRNAIASVINTRSRADWCGLLEGTDACFAPVLDLAEAPHHPHNAARGTYVERDGITQPAPAPRFSASPAAIQGPPPNRGAHSAEILEELGMKPSS